MNVLLLLLLCFVPMSMEARRRSTRAPPATCPRFPRLAHGSALQTVRVARFYCHFGFHLVGYRYSVCGLNGWDHPAPVCVSPSLSCPVPMIANGSVLPRLNNAWLDFFCQPGFQLVGSPALYCDGRSWNGTAPTCVAETIELQLSCDFERDLCGWRQDERHDFDWTRHSKLTPSSYAGAGTGPPYDHTLGNSGAGYYMYIESSARTNNDSARLLSPIFSSDLAQDGCFSLFYHMYGGSIGGLRVYQIPILQIMQLSEVERQDHLLFEKWGNQGNTWFRNVSRLRNTNSNFQIVIEGIRGSSFTSDVAIDDVAILQGDQCNNASITAVTPPDLKSETCLGRCEVYLPPPRAGCKCTIDCVSDADATCCPDYYEQCIFTITTISTNTSNPYNPTITTSLTTTTPSAKITSSTTTTPPTTTSSLTTTTPSTKITSSTTTTPPTTTSSLTTTTPSAEITSSTTTTPPTTTSSLTTTTPSAEITFSTTTTPPTTTSSLTTNTPSTTTTTTTPTLRTTTYENINWNGGSTLANETTELWTMYDETDPSSSSPVAATGTASSPPARPAPRPAAARDPAPTTKPPTTTDPVSTTITSTSTISRTTMEQGTWSDYDNINNTATQTTPGNPVSPNGTEHENRLKENASGSSAILVTVLVPVICLVIVLLVVLLTSYKTIYSKVRRLHPFHFRATFTPNARERGNASEIPIYEFGHRSPGENACTLRANSLKYH